jgi:subtilisin family serine protease
VGGTARTTTDEEDIQMFRLHRLLLAGVLAAVVLAGLGANSAGGYAVDTKTYVITLSGDYAVVDGYAVGSAYAVTEASANYAVYAVTRQYAVYAVQAAGGTITNDLSKQIGVIIAESPAADFATLVQQYAVVDGYAVIDAVSEDTSATQKKPSGEPRKDGGKKTLGSDPLEPQQWGMKMIRSDRAHQRFLGSRTVDVGILDTGIDSTHVDFADNGVAGASNVDCSRAHLSIHQAVPAAATGPCLDTGDHGTHVAGIVAAQANGVGVVGVAPNVTLVPVIVCDVYVCPWSAVIDGIEYAAKQQLDVINMSFYADDANTTARLTDCNPDQEGTVEAIRRAIADARSAGVTPVAALGNGQITVSAGGVTQVGEDLGSDSYKDCTVAPAELPGVIGVSALGPSGTITGYSNYGSGSVDVAAPGGSGNGGSSEDILSTVPGGWDSFAGTSMASPHAAGVAALIVSRYGTMGADGDVKMNPDAVAARLQASATDLGTSRYDKYYGYGRVDALRAIGG